MNRLALLSLSLPLLVLVGCERTRVSIEAPGVSVHTTTEGINVSEHHGEDGPSASGPTKTEMRTTESFHAVEADSSIEVKYVKGSKDLVNVSAQDNILPRVKTEVSDGVLKLSLDNVSNSGKVVVSVVSPSLDAIELSGASRGAFVDLDEPSLKITADGGSQLIVSGKVGQLELDLGGASQLEATIDGDCRLSGKEDSGCHATLGGKYVSADLTLGGASEGTLSGLQATTVSFKLDSGSHLTASGVTDDLTLNAQGAADLELGDLVARTCKIEGDAGSHAKINVTGALTANLSGAASVTYAGHPTVTQTLDGAAQLSGE